MFKVKKVIDNIYNGVNAILNCISPMPRKLANIEEQVCKFNESVKYIRDTNSYKRTIESQQRTIKVLSEALCNKYSSGFFIVSDNGEFPMIIRNGKELTDDLTTSIFIKWDKDSCPEIEVVHSTYTSMDDEIYENKTENI